MASAWNLWVCLECIGVVSGYCKEVYKYPLNNYYFFCSTCISSFLAAASFLLCSFFMFFRSLNVKYIMLQH